MSQASTSTYIYVKYADLPVLDIQLPLMLCEAMNELVPDHPRGAQQFNGLCSIWLRSTETKTYLLEGNFSLSCFHIWRVSYCSKTTPNRKSYLKNVPFHVHGDDVLL